MHDQFLKQGLLLFMKINVGIFFGGPSSEREISFISGRTIYDNLNQSLFNPILIFVDSHCNWVLLDWYHIYQKRILEFYPPNKTFPLSSNGFQIYIESLGQLEENEQQKILSEIGQPITKTDLHQHIDIAFLAIHGEYGEDGQLLEILENLNIPYTGASVKSSQIGMDKILLKKRMKENGFPCSPFQMISQEAWLSVDIYSLYQEVGESIGFPIVVHSAKQNTASTTSIINKDEGLEGFERAVNRAFQRELISLDEWHDRNDFERLEYVKILTDLEDGIGLPITITLGAKSQVIYHPEVLLSFLNNETASAEYLSQVFILENKTLEKEVLFEKHVQATAFSCMVIRAEDGSAIALPPFGAFENDSYYAPGSQFKENLLQAKSASIESIRRACESIFSTLKFQTYLVVNGQYLENGLVYIKQVTANAKINSAGFFFRQAAEIGLNPSQFLTYILRVSLQERIKEEAAQKTSSTLLKRLDQQISQLQPNENKKQGIGVILGGYSYERHLSVNSGRNVFEKLSISEQFQPIPVFLTGSNNQHELFQLPMSLLLDGNADQIKAKISNWETMPCLDKIRRECADITQKYGSENVIFDPQELSYDMLAKKVDGVFIALHGRPGEDGQVQVQLEAHQLPYNGSGIKSTNITIDKFRTLQLLKKHGFLVTNQLLLSRQEFNIDSTGFYQRVEKKLSYPFIAKPVDDGCSSAVKKIHNRNDLVAYTTLLFDEAGQKEQEHRRALKLKTKEIFPVKSEILFEQMITQFEGIHFLEVTGGLFTNYTDKGQLRYQSFELSEIIDGNKDQFVTPARLSIGSFTQEHIQQQIQHTFERAARLLKVEGYCCIDAFIRILDDGKVETQIIEVNSLPDMTPDAIVFQQALFSRQKPNNFINKMLAFGFERRQKNANINIVPLNDEQSKKEAAPPTLATIQTLHTNNMDEPTTEQNSPVATKQQPLAAALKIRFSKIKDFIFSRYLLKNIAVMGGAILLTFLLLNLFLNTYTSHGHSAQVENYTGLSLENAKKKASARGFVIQINEAPFSLDINTGEVIDQEPVALSRIKKNRTIYLTIIGGPKEPIIPSFQDAADEYKQYVPMLNALQVKSIVKEEIFDAKLNNGTILHFFYRGKKYSPSDVKRGVKVLQGSTLEFVITKNFDDNVRLPSLICKRFVEVEFLLNGSGIKVGDINGNVPNRADAYVYKQEPAYRPGKRVVKGSSINVYLQKEKPAGCAAEVEIKAPESDSGGLPIDANKDTTAQKRIPTPIDTSGNGGM